MVSACRNFFPWLFFSVDYSPKILASVSSQNAHPSAHLFVASSQVWHVSDQGRRTEASSPPTSFVAFGAGHITAVLENQRVFTQKKKKTRMAKTSKFFLFFPLSEKRSPPFPSAWCNTRSCQRKLSPRCPDSSLWWALLPDVPVSEDVYVAFCCVFIFPAYRKQSLFLIKISFGSETRFRWAQPFLRRPLALSGKPANRLEHTSYVLSLSCRFSQILKAIKKKKERPYIIHPATAKSQQTQALDRCDFYHHFLCWLGCYPGALSAHPQQE